MIDLKTARSDPDAWRTALARKGAAESFDALCALHLRRDNDNQLFVRRGRPGDKVNADIFLNFWDYFIAFRKSPEAFTRASLFAERVV